MPGKSDPPNVSRETQDRLEAFVDLVKKWNSRINLISRASLPDLWARHIEDSSQLWGLQDDPSTWVDLGSGGGFPGIVIACHQASSSDASQTIMIESDKRKCVFLNTVIQQLELPARVVGKRIETAPSFHATTLSARALASLDKLLGYAQLQLGSDGTALFSKGATWRKELDDAKEKWRFDCDVIQSTTDANTAILKIKNIKRR